MVAKERSFWTTTSGMVTGVAGTLTGIVGIATVAAQLGWIGPEDDASQSAAKQPAAAGATSSTEVTPESRSSGSERASRGGDTTADPAFTVDPSALSFQALGERTATVKLTNTGSVELNVEGITVDGADAGRFTVADSACTSANVDPGRSCEVEVSFSPQGNGTSKATMVIEVEDAPAQEIPLSGSDLL